MIIFGLIFGLLTMTIHFTVVTIELIEKIIPIVKILTFIPKELLIRLRIIFAMITDYFHPEGNMRAKILTLATTMSESKAEDFVKSELDTIKSNRENNTITNEEYFLKSINYLKKQTHPSVKLLTNSIEEVLIVIGELKLKQGMCQDPNGNEYICFKFDGTTYGIYEVDNEIGIIDFSKVNYTISEIWINKI